MNSVDKCGKMTSTGDAASSIGAGFAAGGPIGARVALLAFGLSYFKTKAEETKLESGRVVRTQSKECISIDSCCAFDGNAVIEMHKMIHPYHTQTDLEKMTRVGKYLALLRKIQFQRSIDAEIEAIADETGMMPKHIVVGFGGLESDSQSLTQKVIERQPDGGSYHFGDMPDAYQSCH